MRFTILGRMGPGMRQIIGYGDRSKERGTFGGECGAPDCNQWGVCGVAAPSHFSLVFLVYTAVDRGE